MSEFRIRDMRRHFALFLLCTIFLTIVCSSVASVSVSATETIPEVYMIENVPWYWQVNAFTCGAGSIEMVFDYYGPHISQYEIADAARTWYGTMAFDVVRAGHFSDMSTSVGTLFPPYTCTGYTGRGLGYAAFMYNSETCWLDELKNLIAHDYPVILLMYYADTSGAHYRVAIGYDDVAGELIMIDTWGRDIAQPTDFTGILRFEYSYFEQLWNFVGFGSELPYCGILLVPWSVSLSVNQKGQMFEVNAEITYPCPPPFDCNQFAALNTEATISLPEGFSLKKGEMLTKEIGTMTAGSTVEVSWKTECTGEPGTYSFVVQAEGIVSGEVGETYTKGVVGYPPYSYTDRIGGTGKVTITVE